MVGTAQMTELQMIAMAERVQERMRRGVV